MYMYMYMDGRCSYFLVEGDIVNGMRRAHLDLDYEMSYGKWNMHCYENLIFACPAVRGCNLLCLYSNDSNCGQGIIFQQCL